MSKTTPITPVPVPVPVTPTISKHEFNEYLENQPAPLSEISSLRVPPSGSRGHALAKFFLAAEWAIMPEKLDQLASVLAEYIAGDHVRLEPGKEMPAVPSRRVAVIPIHGTITKRAYGLGAISGVRTTQMIQDDIQAAINDPDIDAIVLSVDSPGGTVAGTKELADFILRAKDQKPIVAYADGLMASAAYWISSAASAIVAYDTSKVGSVGVISVHEDESAKLAMEGRKITFITAGQHKALGNSTEPLSADGKAFIQLHVDNYYNMFVDTIAANRSLERDYVLAEIANGLVFTPQEALDLSLVDRVGSFQDAVSLAIQIGEQKMNEVKEKTQLEDIKTQLDELAAQNQRLSEELKAKEDALQAELDAKQARDHMESITKLFVGTQVSADELAMFAKLDKESLVVVHSAIASRQARLDEVIAELGTPTENAESESSSNGINSIDEAINHIMTRDGVDVDAAMAKVKSEFPDLF